MEKVAAKIEGKIVGYEVFYDGKKVVEKKALTSSEAEEKKDNNEAASTTPESKITYRGSIVRGFTLKLPFEPAGNVYITQNFAGDELVEVFIAATKNNPELSVTLDVLGRLLSVIFKHGVPVEEVVKHLVGADAGQYVLVKFPGKEKGNFVKSVFDLVGRVLQNYDLNTLIELYKSEHGGLREEKTGTIENKVTSKKESNDTKKNDNDEKEEVAVNFVTEVNAEPCPECGSPMIEEGGCWTCKVCGYSKCG